MIWVMELGLGFLLGPLMATALLAEKYMVLLVSSGPVQGQWVRVGDIYTSNQVVHGHGARPIECTGTRFHVPRHSKGRRYSLCFIRAICPQRWLLGLKSGGQTHGVSGATFKASLCHLPFSPWVSEGL